MIIQYILYLWVYTYVYTYIYIYTYVYYMHMSSQTKFTVIPKPIASSGQRPRLSISPRSFRRQGWQHENRQLGQTQASSLRKKPQPSGCFFEPAAFSWVSFYEEPWSFGGILGPLIFGSSTLAYLQGLSGPTRVFLGSRSVYRGLVYLLLGFSCSSILGLK